MFKSISISKAQLLVCVGILNSVTEEASIVTTVALEDLFLGGVVFRTLVLGISASVLAAEVDGHEDLEKKRHAHQAEQDEVTVVELGGVLLEVDERSKDTTKVTESNVHGDTNTTLGGTTDVVTIPGNTLRNVGVDTTGKEEDTGILDVGVGGCDLENDTEHGSESETNHEDTARTETVGEVSTSDAAEAGNDVRRNTHELGLLVAVAEGLDNCGQEEGETVERGVNAKGNEHMHPDFPVFNGIEEVLGAVLICKRATVLFKTAGDLLLLGLVQEFGSLRVVVHVEEGNDGNDESEETLKDEDPLPPMQTSKTVHLNDTASKKTTKGSSGGCSREEDGHSQTAFVAAVPHSDVEGHTGEETTLSQTESSTSSEQAMVVLNNTEESGSDTPENHDEWNPECGASSLHHHVGRNLSQDVEGEEDGQCNLLTLVSP